MEMETGDAVEKEKTKGAACFPMDPTVRSLRIYPTGARVKLVENLKTVGIILDAQECRHLATILLHMAQHVCYVQITGHRKECRKTDGTQSVTVLEHPERKWIRDLKAKHNGAMKGK